MTPLQSLHRVASSGDPATAVQERQQYLRSVAPGADFSHLFAHALDLAQVTRKNCENLIGSVEMPLGVAGPLALRGEHINQEVYIPLATTEGALVASVSRGCKALSQGEGVDVMVERRGMTRSPVFECPTGKDAQRFLSWFEEHTDRIREIAESTSRHLRMLDHHAWIRGRHVYVRFAFDTDEAMGMNMVTIALQAALEEALQRHPEIKLLSLSSNVCTDKKDSVINSLLGRGYWVQAETWIAPEHVRDILHTDVHQLALVHTQKNLIGSNIAGSLAQNAHVANVAAALFIATGQDAAHVVEASQAFLTVEERHGGAYVALTMPNVNVGVVGGGTVLAQQTQARALIMPGREITARQLAAVMAGAGLAGELSLLAALATNTLACAHDKLGRGNVCA